MQDSTRGEPNLLNCAHFSEENYLSCIVINEKSASDQMPPNSWTIPGFALINSN